jgi:hypothetical protein
MDTKTNKERIIYLESPIADLVLDLLAKDGESVKGEVVELDRITFIKEFTEEIVTKSINLLINIDPGSFLSMLILNEVMESPSGLLTKFINDIENEKLDIEITDIMRQISVGLVSSKLLHTEALKRGIISEKVKEKAPSKQDKDFMSFLESILS